MLGLTPVNAREWYGRGNQLLDEGRVDEAVSALERAERGYSDASYLLGSAYLNIDRFTDAEMALLRTIERTTRADLRLAAAKDLAVLYRDLGSLEGYRDMLIYIASLGGGQHMRTPCARLRQNEDGSTSAVAPKSLQHRLRLWWATLSPVRRFIVGMTGFVASTIAIAEAIQQIL